jgi:hypothetical protein
LYKTGGPQPDAAQSDQHQDECSSNSSTPTPPLDHGFKGLPFPSSDPTLQPADGGDEANGSPGSGGEASGPGSRTEGGEDEEDGSGGLLALWALLNLSVYEPAQVIHTHSPRLGCTA